VADSRLNDIDMAIMNAYDRERLLSYKLEEIKKYYDYIIIDSPPIINQATLNILVASDYLLIPVQSNYLGVRGIATLTNTIDKVKQRMNPNIKILGYFVAMYDSRANTDKGIYELIQEQFGELAFKSYIRQNSKLKEAPMAQKTIFEYDRNSNGSIDYYNLCIEIWKRLGGSVNDGK
jgi:chromosome partitioning protein